MKEKRRIISAMLPQEVPPDCETVFTTLGEHFSENVLRFAMAQGVRVQPLEVGQTYKDASRELGKLGIDVDAWPAPPAGLFVVSERTLYIRHRSRMTIAHEFGHALDCALGSGVYLSGTDARIRGAFAAAKTFVTPYAATGADEYFAESVRAYVGANDDLGLWPKATPERLKRIDPTMYALLSDLFADMEARGA